MILLLTGGVIAYKIFALDYTVTTIKPEDGYFIRLLMEVEGNGRNCNVRVTLPIQSERQTIKYEKASSGGGFKYTIDPNRQALWRALKLEGKQSISYSCFAQTEAKKFPLPQNKKIPSKYSKRYQVYLKATKIIQSDDPEIIKKAWELAPEGMDLRSALQQIYDFSYSQVQFRKVRGPTNALTALKLREASCNGKNRLMVALLRARGIPARMANGLILENNRKRTTHAWTEVRVEKQWVPFCPTNGYFAEIPAKYLELAKGDVAVFTHTRHIGFDWKWVIQHQLSHRDKAVLSNATNPLNILHAWTTLKDYHISLDLIMIILMIPIGATVVAFARNIIGLLPYGTFMPALIAVSFRDTGLPLGIAFFLTVIIIGSLVNMLLVRLRLLHIPRLVIIITIVVMSIMALSVVCINYGLATGAAVSLFPMAILSLTCERFTQTMMEDGWWDASVRMVVTFVVASGCYFVYNIETLQMLIVAFPELLLCNIAIAMVIGSWTGLRWMEYFRFRHVLRLKADKSGDA